MLQVNPYCHLKFVKRQPLYAWKPFSSIDYLIIILRKFDRFKCFLKKLCIWKKRGGEYPTGHSVLSSTLLLAHSDTTNFVTITIQTNLYIIFSIWVHNPQRSFYRKSIRNSLYEMVFFSSEYNSFFIIPFIFIALFMQQAPLLTEQITANYRTISNYSLANLTVTMHP